MARITVDDQTAKAIKSSTESVEICDSNGDIIAMVVKDQDGEPTFVDLPPPPTQQELKEILAQPRYTFQQVLEKIGVK